MLSFAHFYFFLSQIQLLLIEKRVEEAIELSNVANSLKSTEFNEKVSRT